MEEKELNLSLVTQQILITDLLGKILDLARMSDMGDRQLKQYTYFIKNNFYESLCLLNNMYLKADKFTVLPTDQLCGKTKDNGPKK